MPEKLLPNFKAGDLIGFSSYSLNGVIINLGTFGIPFYNLSHIGIVGMPPTNTPFLFESTTLATTPCIYNLKKCEGTQAHYLGNRINNYYGKVYHYPLAIPLTFQQKINLLEFLIKHLGQPYDYIGAIRARDFSLIEKLIYRKPDLASMYCSEYVLAAIKHIDLLGNLSPEMNWSPNKLIRFAQKFGLVKRCVCLK